MPNFDGTLIKIRKPDGTYVDFPTAYIRAGTYQFTDSGQDLDSYVDANGNLHRNALKHRRIKAEWSSPTMFLDEYQKMVSYFSSNYTNVTEKKLHAKLYTFAADEYKEVDVYMPDWTEAPYYTSKNLNTSMMSEVRFAMIEY